MNRIFYIMGKSSSGKDSIFRKLLLQLNITPVILYTTRPKRENERDGIEYHFVDSNSFELMKAEGRVVEYRTYNTVHGEWTYFTARDSIDLETGSCIGIGTLESYVKMKEVFGEAVVPIYIEVEDGIRLTRAVERERLELSPRYAELCRRFLADSDDFCDEKLASAGITKRFSNNGSVEDCISEIIKYIKSCRT